MYRESILLQINQSIIKRSSIGRNNVNALLYIGKLNTRLVDLHLL